MLFICQGNICRSPYAAAAFADKLPERLRQRYTTRSAGFIGPGRASPANAIAAAAALGIDLASHLSSALPEELPDAPSLIVVMDADQSRRIRERFTRRKPVVLQLGDLDPAPISRRPIPDPIDASAPVFQRTYQRIDRCVAELCRLLTTSG